MQPLSLVLTTMLFTAHAVLGCCAHHACGSSDGHDRTAASHTDHDCGTHHDGRPPDPADDGQQPVSPCQHGPCNFVKIEPVRIDQGSQQVVWLAASMPAANGYIDYALATNYEREIPAASSCAHLYVCFCALLI